MVQAGRATLVTASGTVPVEPGSVVFVPAGETHRFTDITEDLALVVVFAPPLRIAGGGLRFSVRNYWPERTMVAASSMPRRASASARSLPGSPA